MIVILWDLSHGQMNVDHLNWLSARQNLSGGGEKQ